MAKPRRPQGMHMQVSESTCLAKVTPSHASGRHRGRCGCSARPLSGARHRAGRADQARASHREDRAARPRRHPDGAGRAHFFEGNRLHDGRPQGRACHRRHRRRSGGRQDQGPGTGRARQGRCHPRPARRLRTVGHHRLYPRAEDADAQPRRRRRHVRSGGPIPTFCARRRPRRRRCTRWVTMRRPN